jgi:site-specific recombinase XerC
VVEMEIDWKVFELEFDPHNRGKESVRLLKALIENKYPKTGKELSKINQEKLLEYCYNMISRIKRNELAVGTFWKNVQEIWRFLLLLNCDDITKLTQKNIEEWWQIKLKQYENREIKYSTLQKSAKCEKAFLRFLFRVEQPKQIVGIKMPKPPKRELRELIPSQLEVKKLIDAIYVDGKKYTIRDQAIIALINDTGARTSEVLSIRNKHIKAENNYLIVSFPESKTLPRTVISFLAKPFLENWAKISPNKDKGPDAFFFCQQNGLPVNYPSVKKAFNKALKKSQIPWKKGQAMHYLRHIFTTRAFEWPYAVKQYWLGWALKSIEGTYSEINYKHCTKAYFNMIKEENNPFMKDEPVFWEQEKIEEKVIAQLLETKPEFKMLLRQMVRETMSNF